MLAEHPACRASALPVKLARIRCAMKKGPHAAGPSRSNENNQNAMPGDNWAGSARLPASTDAIG